jgi:hypothetical protein
MAVSVRQGGLRPRPDLLTLALPPLVLAADRGPPHADLLALARPKPHRYIVELIDLEFEDLDIGDLGGRWALP